MTALEEKPFDEVAAECEAILSDLERDIHSDESRWQEVLNNARSNKSVLDVQAEA